MKEEALAYEAKANAFAYGPGASVYACFQCATEEKADALVKLLRAFGGDARPDWDKMKEQK